MSGHLTAQCLPRHLLPNEPRGRRWWPRRRRLPGLLRIYSAPDAAQGERMAESIKLLEREGRPVPGFVTAVRFGERDTVVGRDVVAVLDGEEIGSVTLHIDRKSYFSDDFAAAMAGAGTPVVGEAYIDGIEVDPR